MNPLVKERNRLQRRLRYLVKCKAGYTGEIRIAGLYAADRHVWILRNLHMDYQTAQGVVSRVKWHTDKRGEITDEWHERGAVGIEYARLTNDVTSTALGQSATELTRALQIKRGTLREHLSEPELATIKVVETAAASLHSLNDSHGVNELESDIDATDPIAKAAREVFGKAGKRPK